MNRRSILVTAHAGCLGTVSNSLDSLEAALRSGADVVEVDVRAAPDGPVLTHDPTATGSRYLSLVAALDFAERHRTTLNLDVKEASVLSEVAELVRRRDLRDLVIFSGLDEEGVRLARNTAPEFRYLLNADMFLPISGYGEYAMSTACSVAATYGCCGINLDWRAARPVFVEYARRRCLPVFLWTPDAPGDLAAAIALSPYSITTNRPDLLLRMIGRCEEAS